ncbi:hypothetical protein K0U83_12105 [bacterium]|nr:hypothetical protein [bacterium]
MSIELSPILRVRAASEAAFGTDETGSLGNFVDVPFRTDSVTWTTDREMLDPMTGKQRIDDFDFKIPGWRRGTLTMTHNLAPTGTAAADGVTAVQSALGLLLKIGMGGESLDTGDLTASSSAADIVNVVTGTNSMSLGNAIGIERASDSRYEMRTIQSGVGSTAIVTKMDLSAAAPDPVDAYASATYYLTSNPAESAQFIVEGAEADDGWLLMGCQLDSIAIDTTLGQIPTITLSWKCAGYLLAAETAGSIGGATAATITNYSPIIAEGDFIVRRTTTGSTLPSPTCMASITINFGLTYNEVPCPSGVNGIARYRRVRSVPVASVTYQTYYEDDQAWDDQNDKEPRAITWQMGTTPGESVMLEWPNAQVVNPQRVDGGGIASQSIACEGHEDAEVTGTATDATESAFRIHFG